MNDQPEAFHEPLGTVDYRLGSDGKAQELKWRRDTPPAGEDGSVPDRRLTIGTIMYPNTPVSGPGVFIPEVSTLDLEIG